MKNKAKEEKNWIKTLTILCTHENIIKAYCKWREKRTWYFIRKLQSYYIQLQCVCVYLQYQMQCYMNYTII